MAIEKKTVFVTSDGQEFLSEADAEKHERALEMRPLIAEFLDELSASGYRSRYVRAAERTLLKFSDYLTERAVVSLKKER